MSRKPSWIRSYFWAGVRSFSLRVSWVSCDKKISFGDKIRIGGYVKDSSLKKISLNQYEFKITDNKNDLLVFYQGILPDLFREGQGTVIEGLIENQSTVTALKVYAKHDENYMPASIKKELEKNNQWKKDYKWSLL